MRKANPRHRYEAIKLKQRAPENELERSLCVLLHGKEVLNTLTPQRPWPEHGVIDSSVEYPYDVFKVDPIRAVLEAFLLSSNDDYEIGQALAMPSDEVGAYRYLFFDTAAFRTDLELIVFMQSIPEDAEYKQIYKIAFHQGLGALQWHFCRNKKDPDAKEVVKTIMTDSFYRALENRGLPSTHKVAQEAMKLAKLSVECARVFIGENSGTNTDTEALRIKFESIRKNKTIHDFKTPNGPAEILH